MKRVLAVDDSRTMRMALTMVLKSEGYAVTTAEDGAEALEKLKKGETYDLIITDINMPNMDGYSLIKHARQMAGCRLTPVMVLSTETSEEKKAEGKKAGADHWLEKPFRPENLIIALRNIASTYKER